MNRELREICTRFRDAIDKDFSENLKELEHKQPPNEFLIERQKLYQRYYSWIMGFSDELGNNYTQEQRRENSGKVKQMLTNHMVCLTKNKALGIWLERASFPEWSRIIWDMRAIKHIPYSWVLYRFTYAVIINYLRKFYQIFTVSWGGEDGTEMYQSLEKQLVQCLNLKECAYWQSTEE